MNFETHLSRERCRNDCKESAMNRRRLSRIETREERRRRQRVWMQTATAILLACVFGAAAAAMTLSADGAEPESTAQAAPDAAKLSQEAPAPADVPEDCENEKIEAALYASGYFREDVPLDGDTQALLHAACDESGVPYALALAVIAQETGFRNVTGDDGASCGYMQIQEQWHRDRMERLGVTDLTDPFGNFRVGCDYLAELMGRYSLEEALTAYNSGRPGKSRYASAVLETMEGYL